MKMPMSQQAAQKLVWEALFKHDGDRNKAAKEMGVTLRTFYRYIKTLEMYPLLDRMGWAKPGPPRGEPRGHSVVKMRVLAHIKKHRGKIEYGDLAIEVYNEDSPVHRQRLYTAMEHLKKQGRVEYDYETDLWQIVKTAVIK